MKSFWNYIIKYTDGKVNLNIKQNLLIDKCSKSGS